MTPVEGQREREIDRERREVNLQTVQAKAYNNTVHVCHLNKNPQTGHFKGETISVNTNC